jgi:hypothetical protein
MEVIYMQAVTTRRVCHKCALVCHKCAVACHKYAVSVP